MLIEIVYRYHFHTAKLLVYLVCQSLLGIGTKMFIYTFSSAHPQHRYYRDSRELAETNLTI